MAMDQAELILDVPTVQLPITGIELFEGESRFNTQGQIFNTNLTA